MLLRAQENYTSLSEVENCMNIPCCHRLKDILGLFGGVLKFTNTAK
jgi:hypothetical protein